ncbi:alpha/beta hydrolase [Deinococcus arenicola]|uniref:Alpha/beta hydrolase-fold protein n=1 Tax=Deinococcus arenicola TaxID=2994950 RepID=A0ABU4DTE9_9DEIO|nr:alpha/beta hydrolase-fold protein [Deinococcus sp. ZS9-10]MDV6375700.1 alpha/beta hydrolase-fold protein [Deinococcus sp. ZS9-10]
MAQVRFVIPKLPPDTPEGILFLTGDHRQWSNDPAGWTFSGRELQVELPEGALLGVKVRVLHDGQTTEEGDIWGGRTPAHKAVVGGDMEIRLQLEGWQDARQGRERPSACAPPREELTLDAPWGPQVVRLWWSGSPTQPLPLLLLHDGQNVFDEASTFAGESWNVAGAAQTLAAEGFPCLIAALSVNDERNRRYGPFPFELNGFNPGADGYLDWIVDTLKPALAERFGVGDAAHTALAGSSFGGLVTLYGGLRGFAKHSPAEFGTLGVFSPAIFPADFELLRWMEGREASQTRVWLDMGDREASTLEAAAEMVQLTHQLADKLRPKMREVHVTIGVDHWHDEAAWAERFPAFLRWWLEGLPSR